MNWRLKKKLKKTANVFSVPRERNTAQREGERKRGREGEETLISAYSPSVHFSILAI